MIRSNEQKLVDICFQLALTMRSNRKYFKKLTIEETAEWVARQLKECGFPTTPMGMSWGVLDSSLNNPPSRNETEIKIIEANRPE